jgi:hypothetical protein
MDSGVGASRTLDVGLDAEEFIGGALQLPLHGARVQLYLPTGISGAIIFESQFVGPHVSLYTWWLRLIGAIEKFNLIPVSDQPTMRLCARFFGAAHLAPISAVVL